MLDSVAGSVGIKSGVSLVLFAGIVLLLLVCLHLSWESSRLEAETRTLAEDIALVRTQLDRQAAEIAELRDKQEHAGEVRA
jgi:sensor domain CHASE-containing protein